MHCNVPVGFCTSNEDCGTLLGRGNCSQTEEGGGGAWGFGVCKCVAPYVGALCGAQACVAPSRSRSSGGRSSGRHHRALGADPTSIDTSHCPAGETCKPGGGEGGVDHCWPLNLTFGGLHGQCERCTGPHQGFIAVPVDQLGYSGRTVTPYRRQDGSKADICAGRPVYRRERAWRCIVGGGRCVAACRYNSLSGSPLPIGPLLGEPLKLDLQLKLASMLCPRSSDEPVLSPVSVPADDSDAASTAAALAAHTVAGGQRCVQALVSNTSLTLAEKVTATERRWWEVLEDSKNGSVAVRVCSELRPAFLYRRTNPTEFTVRWCNPTEPAAPVCGYDSSSDYAANLTYAPGTMGYDTALCPDSHTPYHVALIECTRMP